MNTLIIVESPGKCQKLKSILGPGYTVEASKGHVRDLPINDLAIDLTGGRYAMKYETTKDRKDVVARLKKAVERADEVILATDPDREGEAIAWHLQKVLGLKSPKRMTYTEITEAGIRKALANIRSIDMDLVHAQEARRAVDRIVGYRGTEAIRNKTGKPFTEGRVLSVAVRLLAEREWAIRHFVPVTHYGALWHFEGPWSAKWDTGPLVSKADPYVLDKTLAEAAAGCKECRVVEFAHGKAQKAPPPPFTTTSLQNEAQKKLKFSTKKTMQLAQALYEAGLITYMRTDSPNLAEEAAQAIRDLARKNGWPHEATTRTWKAKAAAQEGHEAIRPTHVEDRKAGQSADEQALYDLIWMRAVCSQLASATYATRTLKLESLEAVLKGKDGMQKALFKSTSKTLTASGWLAVAGKSAAPREEGEEDSGNLPELAQGTVLSITRGQLTEHVTEPPARYTRADLTNELERRGIGRPSTYVNLHDKIETTGYATVDAKFVMTVTEKGEGLVKASLPLFSFLQYDYTTQVEETLDRVAQGKLTYETAVDAFYKKLEGEFGLQESKECPDCHKRMRKIVGTGKNGPYEFWGCTGYPKCRATVPA